LFAASFGLTDWIQHAESKQDILNQAQRSAGFAQPGGS
jgi:hypothetical protein